MSRRMRRPDTVRLTISHDDWLLVNKYITAGEQRKVFARMVKTLTPGKELELNILEVGRATAVAYLLDWSIEDADGRPVVIRDQPPDVVGSALDNLPPEDFAEIVEAITAHEQAVQAELEAQKKTGSMTSEPVLTS